MQPRLKAPNPSHHCLLVLHGTFSAADHTRDRPFTQNRRKIHNYTVPAHFTFGWANLMSPNTSTTTTSSRPAAPGGWNGTAALLVLRSTNPASAHHCPDFPHDACWAQGLHWVPRADVVTVRRKGGGGSGVEGQEEYVGAEDLVVVGRYCRSGVPECAWSEYLY